MVVVQASFDIRLFNVDSMLLKTRRIDDSKWTLF